MGVGGLEPLLIRTGEPGGNAGWLCRRVGDGDGFLLRSRSSEGLKVDNKLAQSSFDIIKLLLNKRDILDARF